MSRSLHASAASLVLAFFLLAGCSEDDAANARRQIRKQHMAAVKRIIAGDMKRHRQGIWKAAAKIGPGFVVEDPDVRERQMRAALRTIDDPNAPPKVQVPELVASAKTFIAAVGMDGKVIARDSDADHMKGEDFGKKYPAIRRALEQGKGGYQLGEFEPIEDDGESSFSMMFIAPVEHEGERVGAVVTGIPLWRLAQRLSRQLRLEHAEALGRGMVVWAYVYKGDRLFSHRGSPAELESEIPDAGERGAELARSPGGYTGKMRAFGRSYGYGVLPVPRIADDVGVIVVRADASQEPSSS